MPPRPKFEAYMNPLAASMDLLDDFSIKTDSPLRLLVWTIALLGGLYLLWSWTSQKTKYPMVGRYGDTDLRTAVAEGYKKGRAGG